MCAENRIAYLERRIIDLEQRLRKAEAEARSASVRLGGLHSEITGTFYLSYMEVTTLLLGLCGAAVAMRRNVAAGILIATLSLLWWWTVEGIGRERR